MKFVDGDGREWSQYLNTSGENTAKQANTIVDWLTDTGMAKSDQKVPRRYLRRRKGKEIVVVYTSLLLSFVGFWGTV